MLESIQGAIVNRCLLSFRYDGYMCVVEPYILGSHHDRLRLQAWQLNGPKPGWREFNVADILNLRVLEGTFERARPGYNPKRINWTIHCSLGVGAHRTPSD
jgi:hypothetical protein